MAWCPFAQKLELQPESDQQPAIRPTQFILHSIIAPWTARRTYEYWQTTNLESHFGLGYEGDLGQFIGTETRADANYQANRRPDGTGAVSIETASNTSGTDPWTPEQIEQLIQLGVWLHRTHGIPLRICRTHDDPGFGYHRLHSQWAVSGTNCPGDARVRQFKEVVFPGIVARATGKTTTPTEEDDMDPVDVWAYKGKDETRDVYWYQRDTNSLARQARDDVRAVSSRLDRLEKQPLTDAQITAIAAAVASSPKLADAIADKLAARLAD
ncbi:peptidoglycan recognition protein family protein [Streptomyces sp. NPDC003314]